MKKIDAHNHFWKFDPVRDSWINDDMKVIQKDFLPADFEDVLRRNHFEGCVVVQSDQSTEENEFQLKNSETFDFIKGIVGWVDLQSENINDLLIYYSQFTKLKGFRHVLQGEPQRDLMLQPAFMHGIRQLNKYNFTYDILIYADQLRYIPKFVSQFPDQLFILNHMAKPNIKENQIQAWKKDIESVALFKNVYCKVSGLVTEANWFSWTQDDIKPYISVVVDCFGLDRIMFGSDWPVCQVAASYEQVISIVEDYFSDYSKDEQDKVFAINAKKVYNL